jgi:hypothetical protein
MQLQGQIISIPSQMVSDKEKQDDAWKRGNIDSFESLVLFENRQVKTSWLNKLTNYNLKRGILNIRDLEKVCDPMGLGLDSFPATLEHKGIGNAKIDLLVGEHMKRKFDWRVTRSSSDQTGIREVEEKKVKELQAFFQEALTASYSPEELESRITDIQKYINSPFFDIAESGCNKILKYDYKYYHLKELFDNTFEDAIIAAEQYASVENIGGELSIRKEDPTKVFTLMDAYATTEAGLEAYVIVDYHTVSSLVDMFHDELTPQDLKKLESYKSMGGNNFPTYSQYGSIGELMIPSDSITAQMQGIVPVSEFETTLFSSAFDSRGNIRLLKCGWKSKRKIKIIKRTDENGVAHEKPVHEKYKIDELAGEELVKEKWINEWWRGYKIGTDIYVGIEPVPFLSTSLDNISKQQPPLVLQIYNTNTSKAQSLMDIIKPYDYLYNIFSYKRELLINLLHPDLVTFPTTMIPDNMTIEEYLNYAMSTGYMPQDPSADIITPKGTMAAGQMNTVIANKLSSTQSGPINTITQVMQDVIQTMDIVSGVTQQRQGAISSNELVGNTERSVTQSSHTTERWFARNDYFKQRVLDKILNTHLNILRKNPKKLAYLTDDFTAQVLTDDEMDAILTGEFNVLVSKSSDDALLLQKLDMVLQMGIQAGTVSMSEVIDMYKNESVSEISRLFKEKERQRAEQAAKQEQQQNEIQQQQLTLQQQREEMLMQLEQQKLEIEREKMMLQDAQFYAKLENELYRENIRTYSRSQDGDLDNDGIPDATEVMRAGLKKEEVQIKANLEKEKLRVQERMAERQAALKEKEILSREKIAKMKPNKSTK